jgi:cytochrome d ubiquinol oxidase subunit II
VVLAGGLILLPSLVLLFRLTLAGRFRDSERIAPATGAGPYGPGEIRARPRVAVACLIAGFGLLNIANAGWAHAIGVTCLISFVALGFAVIAEPALDESGGTDSWGRTRA